MTRKRSFFEKLTGTVARDDEHNEPAETAEQRSIHLKIEPEAIQNADDESVGELGLDVSENDNDIIIRAMLAGVYPEDVDLTIMRDRITIEGSRRKEHEEHNERYHYKELYWGSFTRTITLPAEVEPEEAEATEKHGLLTIRLPKINKDKERRLKVRAM